MSFTVYPGDSNAFQDQWPLVGRGDGILGDASGGAAALEASGASPTVTVQPFTASVAGFGCVSDAVETLDLSTVGTQPTTGQKRVDLVVARYDFGAADLDTAFTLAVRPGTPVSTSTTDDAAAPAPVQTAGTTWELPLWRVSRPAGGVVNAIRDERVWSPYVDGTAAPAATLRSTGVHVGTIMRRGRELWRRARLGSGTSWLLDNNLRIFRAGFSLIGPSPADGGLAADGLGPAIDRAFLVQAGSTVGALNSLGRLRVQFPSPFPNGLVSLVITNGDHGVGAFTFNLRSGPGTGLNSTRRDGFEIQAVNQASGNQGTPGTLVRVNFIAIGW